MKRILSAVLLAASSLFCATAAQSAVVSFSASSSSIAIGETTSVGVSISGLGSEVLSGFDINFIWNAAVLQATGLNFSPACSALGAGAFCETETAGVGNQGLFFASFLLDDDLAAVQADSFLLGTLTFEGLANGASTVTLGASQVFDRNFVGRDFASLSAEIGSVCIAVGTGSCVNAVPEPSTFALLLLAVAGAFAPHALRRRGARHAVASLR